jgi:hypothetical protein
MFGAATVLHYLLSAPLRVELARFVSSVSTAVKENVPVDST